MARQRNKGWRTKRSEPLLALVERMLGVEARPITYKKDGMKRSLSIPGVLEQSLEGEVELLWLTSEVRQDRPTVLDEVSSALWYLETRLLEANDYMHATLALAFEDEFARSADAFRLAVPLRFGTWVGGDRDGNPYVTPSITIATARRASHVILGRYGDTLEDLTRRLSLSSSIAPPLDALIKSLEKDQKLLPLIWKKNRKRNADEPLRRAIRAAEKEADRWVARSWVKKGILLGFRIGSLSRALEGSAFPFFDKDTMAVKDLDVDAAGPQGAQGIALDTVVDDDDSIAARACPASACISSGLSSRISTCSRR